MTSYRIRTAEGVEIAIVEAASLIETVNTPAASHAPLLAEVFGQSGARMLARKEQWLGQYPGWSLVAPPEGETGGD